LARTHRTVPHLLHVLVVAALLALSVPFGPAAEALAVAPGCTGSRPTAIGGGISADVDGRSVNALVGIELKAATSFRLASVNVDGRPIGGGYSAIDNVNRTLPADGSTDRSLQRHWGRQGSTADLCVARNITMVYIEVYPQRFVSSLLGPSSGDTVTDRSRFGAAAHYAQPIRPGARNDFELRLPTRYEFGGSTGYVAGYLDYRGQPVPVDLGCDHTQQVCNGITRIRAFSLGRGPDCGIEGFATGPDEIGTASSGTSDYFRIDALAGGRCGAAYQPYTVYVDCVTFCGGGVNAVRAQVRVVKVPSRRGASLNVSWS
jgi:hypothetical protein